MVKHTFKKQERVTNKTIIKQLFSKGNSFNNFPIRLVWIEQDADGHFPVEVLISVPKRAFPHATDRNQVRRRIREAYRLHKYILFEDLKEKVPNKKYSFCLLYNAPEIQEYAPIEQAVKNIMIRFLKIVANG
jgi:ribonuclease P protein component